jgi:hypothetical protein
VKTLFRWAAICGFLATLGTMLLLFGAERSVPLVNAILATGVPVVYYGGVMVILLSATIGLGVSMVVFFLGSGKRYHKSKQKDYGKRFLGYGGVGFLTLGVPAMLMDPAAMSAGMGVVVLWKVLATRDAEIAELQAVLLREREPLAEEISKAS